MAYKNLKDFINKIKKENELLEINTPVSSDLEITEITDRACKEKEFPNKALIFNNVEGYDMPVLTNAFGSYNRMALALGVKDVKEIAKRIEELTSPEIPDTFAEKAGMLPRLLEVGSFFPRMTKDAPCQEVVITDLNQPVLDKLPILKCWPGDGGPLSRFPL